MTIGLPLRILKLIAAALFLAAPLCAEQVKTIGNPWTGKPDYITSLSSTSLLSGATPYPFVQNTLTPTTTTQQFSVNIASAGIVVSSQVTTTSKEFVMEETGDQFGASRLRLRNRDNFNGAVFENPTLKLVDFVFLDQASNSLNIRMEDRFGGVISAPEFQIGSANTPSLIVGGQQQPVGVCSWGGGITPTLQFRNYDSIAASRIAGDIETPWVVTTDASRLGRVNLRVGDFNGLKTFIQADTNGTSPYSTFFGSSTFVSSVTINGPLIQNGTAGTVGQLLTSNGNNAAPTWTTVSASGGGSNLLFSTGTATGYTAPFSTATVAVIASSHSFNGQLVGGATVYLAQNFIWPIRVETAHSTSTTNGCAIAYPASSFTSMLLCDASLDEDAMFSTILMPYNGGPLYADLPFSEASATSGNVVDTMQVFCSTMGSVTDIDTVVWPAANSATFAVPSVAGGITTGTIPLSITGGSCVQGALIMVHFVHNGTNGSDSATGDQEIRSTMRIHEN